MPGGRTVHIVHKGERVLIAEGQDGTIEFRFGPNGDARVRPNATTYRKACHEALTWMLDNAGEMKGNYER
jgi:hypothetical protein